MKKALVIDADEIKRILAEKFNVPEAQVIRSKYSYIVVFGECHETQQEKDD